MIHVPCTKKYSNFKKIKSTSCSLPKTPYMMPVTEQQHVETQTGEYYSGNSGEVVISATGNGVILFENPSDSEIVVTFNLGEYDNYSAVNTKISVSSYGTIEGDMKRTHFITSSLIRKEKTASKARIYIGRNVNVSNAEINRILLLPSYHYKQVYPYGTLMLEPGESRIYEITTVEQTGEAVITMQFEWWEKAV